MGDSPLAERLSRVQQGIEAAARDAGRDASELTTIVVTKFHPVDLIRELYDLGVRNVGESRHQEAQGKAAALADLDLTWHFVGQVQSNKARQVARYARVIHSIDRPALVEALDQPERRLDCFVQINLTAEAGRGGVALEALEPLVDKVLDVPRLNLLGVMAVAPIDEEPRRAFARLRIASERVRAIASGATSISAGMSQDYAAAIAEGATHLRIGTAITGNRPAHG